MAPGSLGSRLPPPRGRAPHPPLPFSALHHPPQLPPTSGSQQHLDSLTPHLPQSPPHVFAAPGREKAPPPPGCSHPWYPPRDSSGGEALSGGESGTTVGSQGATGHPQATLPAPVMPWVCLGAGGQGDPGGRRWRSARRAAGEQQSGNPNPGSRAPSQPPFTRQLEENSEVLGAASHFTGRTEARGGGTSPRRSIDTLQCSVVEHRPLHEGGGSESQSRAPAWAVGLDSRYEAQPGVRNPGLDSHP